MLLRAPCRWLIPLLAVAAACSAPGSSTPTAPTSTPTTTPVTLPPPTTTTVVLPPPAPVEWRACGGGLDCATVTVPISYQDPAEGSLELALVRRPAGHPDERIGSLLVNPGGPGASGVRRVERGFDVSPEVADRFDIVGFDPRGIGQSTPITCGAAVPALRATDLAPDTAAERTALDQAAQAVADECIATEGAVLPHLGTIAVANDVEVIRRALGEAQISFVGLSYGTLIGQLWADAYPESVRALVLDGVVNPAAVGATASADQAVSIENAFGAMAEACTADATCPLAGTGGLRASYDELARRLEAGEGSPALAGPNQLVYAVFFATYDPGTWPLLWQGVADGLTGDLAGIAGLASSYEHLVPYAPFALVTCLDGDHPLGFEAWEAQAAGLARSSRRFGLTLANELLPCAFWPAAPDAARRVTAADTPPILVIGSTGDAATPYESAVEVANTLRSGVLLTVELDGHVALGDSPCATAAATRYLVDLSVPEPGARC